MPNTITKININCIKFNFDNAIAIDIVFVFFLRKFAMLINQV